MFAYAHPSPQVIPLSLRVISGSAKGRLLKSVPGDTTRPITDRVKESLFDIIGSDVLDSRWWDLFAGTGAVGIEALSRGAAFALFTDLNRLPIETIKSNLATSGLAARAEVRRGDAFALLASPPRGQFHYIYIAPPQFHDLWAQSLQVLDEHIGHLADDGWIIVQIAPSESHDIPLHNLQEFDRRKYGSTLLIFYERPA